MQSVQFFALAAIAIGLVNCSQPDAPAPETEDTTAVSSSLLAQADLFDAEGNSVGTASLYRKGETLPLEVTIEGLEPGERAFHLHTTGVCQGPDFKSAGGHLNPFDKSHGRLSENGKHLGDLPNLSVSEGTEFNQAFTLEGNASELLPTIFDEDGTAVMIHEGPDDYATDPAGAAGPRIACGVLKQTS